MTTYSLSTYVTALAAAQLLDPKGGLVHLIQTLSSQIPIFADVHMEECNDGSGHKGTTEYYQPVGTWRMWNEGVAAEAPITAQFREVTANMASIFQADKGMILHKARGNASTASQIRAMMCGQFSAGMLKAISTSLLYGTRSDGKSPLGLFKRSNYNALSSDYVHDNAGGAASATANKASLLLLGHGSLKYHWIYPTGITPPSGSIEQPGKSITGFGIRNDPVADGFVTDIGGTNKYLAVQNWLTTEVGQAVEDARYVQRICNISTSAIDSVDDFGFDEEVAIHALEQMPDLENAIWYCNSTVRTQIRNRNNSKGNVFYTPEQPNAPEVLTLCGIPVHRWDSMTSTEATVT
jgi:hypothetical protein